MHKLLTHYEVHYIIMFIYYMYVNLSTYANNLECKYLTHFVVLKKLCFPVYEASENAVNS